MTEPTDPAIVTAVLSALEDGVKAIPDGLQAVVQASGLALLASGAKGKARILLDALNSGDDNLQQALAADRIAERESYRERLEQKIDGLIADVGLSEGLLTNIVAIFAEHAKTRSRTADAKKARLLMGALVNAFDPAMYKSGMTVTLFKILETLDYGDVYVLNGFNQVAAGLRPEFRFGAGDADLQAPRGSELRWHVWRLREAGLVYWTTRVGPEADFEIRDMARSEIGGRMLRLIGEDALREANEL